MPVAVVPRFVLASPADRPADGARRDPLLVTGLALTGAAIGTWVLGGAALAGAEDSRHCVKRTGRCFPDPDHKSYRTGSGLLGVGIGAAVVAVPMALAGLGTAPKEGARTSEPRMVVGAIMTDLGAALLGASVTIGAWEKNGTTNAMPLMLGLGGGLLVGVGVPLWATGQRAAAPDLELTDPRVAQAHYYRGAKRMEIAGLVLSLAGATGVITGGVMAATADTSRGDFGGYAVIPGVIVTGMSITLLMPGIPLWIIGARRSPHAIFGNVPVSLTLGSSGTGGWLRGTF